MSFRRVLLGMLVVVMVGVLTVQSGAAEELKEGFVIDKSNIDQVLEDTFEGKKIKTMLTDGLEYQIRNWGLKIRIGHTESLPIPAQQEATEKYSDQVTYNPETRMAEGWVAGIPFPGVEVGDKHAGIKAYWNAWAARPFGNYYDCRGKNVVSNVEAQDGKYKQVVAVKNLYRMAGRLGGDPTLGNGEINSKKFLYFTAPYDVRGVGTYILRYVDGRPDDAWVYIRSVRRIRRISQAWMDYAPNWPILNSEVSIEEAHPTWFKSYKLLDKRKIFTPVKTTGGTLPVYHEDAPTEDAQHEMYNLDEWPHWNLDSEVVEWQPKMTYVIEIIPPKRHPYGRKLLYVNAENWFRFYAEDFDKKNELWKVVMRAQKRVIGMDGMKLVGEMGFGPAIDFRAKEATLVSIGHKCAYNSYGVEPSDLTADQLKYAEPPPRGRNQ